MRHPADRFPCSRSLESLLPPPPSRVMLLTGRSWAARAVLVWTVLAGLFFMHGAASPAGGCEAGAPVTTITVPLSPGGAASVVPHAGQLTVTRTPPGPAVTRAAAVSLASSPAGDSCCGGMPCSSRQPRDTQFGAALVPAHGAAAVTAAGALPPSLDVTAGQGRPPGRPGLPLPLFLGVSRT